MVPIVDKPQLVPIPSMLPPHLCHDHPPSVYIAMCCNDVVDVWKFQRTPPHKTTSLATDVKRKKENHDLRFSEYASSILDVTPPTIPVGTHTCI